MLLTRVGHLIFVAIVVVVVLIDRNHSSTQIDVHLDSLKLPSCDERYIAEGWLVEIYFVLCLLAKLWDCGSEKSNNTMVSPQVIYIGGNNGHE